MTKTNALADTLITAILKSEAEQDETARQKLCDHLNAATLFIFQLEPISFVPYIVEAA